MQQKSLSIFDYMDVHLFLKDYYDLQKIKNKKFSYATWAADLGFTNKTILRMMLQKKRTISVKSMAALVNNLNFTELEIRYFETLVHSAQAKNSTQKQAYGAALVKIQRETFTQKVLEMDSGVLFDVYGPIILTIINSADKALNISEIQSHCGLELNQIEKILSQFVSSKLIKVSGDLYSAQHSAFKIQDHHLHPNLQNYYKFWREKSSTAIALPFEIRRFRSLQIALTEDEFNQIVQKTNEFATMLLSMVQTNSIEDRKLYLLNTALFPVREVST